MQLVRPSNRLAAIAALAGLASLLTCPPVEATVDYQLFERVLVQNVRNGYVDYEGIRADPAFVEFLAQLAEKPDATETETDSKATLALLINAYNAFAIKGILDGHSPVSLPGRHRYFKSLKYQLRGESISLEDLAATRISTQGDPRIHFAIVCASISCPRLWSHAYLPGQLDEQLDAAAKRFVNDITRNRFDVAQRIAFVSQIFESFQAEFARSAGSVPAYMARYASDGAVQAALEDGRLRVKFLPYDWELNGSVSARGAR